jgi:hypothetical protein
VRRVSGESGASSGPDDAAGPVDSSSSPSNPANASPVGQADSDLPADATDIEELLRSLSLARLAMAAELSAAAGALDDQRPDVAADLVLGAQSDLRTLRAGVVTRQAKELAPAFLAAGGGAGESSSQQPARSEEPPATPRRSIRLGRWQGKVLAGALALGVSLLVLPHAGGGSTRQSPPAGAAAAPQQIIDVKLVSSEFSTLRDALQARTVAAPIVLTAGRNWHSALALSLVTASTHTGTATEIVKMLREERALLASPAMRTPALRAAAVSLKANSDSLFARLRRLADTKVLAVLPQAITALPLPLPVTPTPTTAPGTGTSPTPKPQVTPDPQPSTGPTTVPTAPVPPVNVPTQPAPTAAPTTAPPVAPIPLPTLPNLPSLPLPSLPALPNLLGSLSGGRLPSTTTGSSTTSSQQTMGTAAEPTEQPATP